MQFFKRSFPSHEQKEQEQPFSSDLLSNTNLLKEAFFYPTNQSLKTRNIDLPHKKKGVILFLEGTVETKAVEARIIEPLLNASGIPENAEGMSALITNVLTTSNAKQIATLQEAIVDLLSGNTLVLLEDEPFAISVVTTGFENRAVTEPKVENVVRGPKEAFNELMSVNQSLIRKLIKDNRLICESLTVGKGSVKQVSIMYIKDVADDEILNEVKLKLNQIQSDSIQNLSILEQHLESRTYSLVPSTFMTERPDRTCSLLLDGHVVLLMDNSPYALIVPVTFWSLFHSVEDKYIRWPYANFIRMVRLIAALIALYMPALYLAVSTYHVEMLPPDLLFAIAATRERVPFPVLWEVLLMEITFEILREAGIRIPSVIGPMLGIVGALILGQAAVQANIVSPILVVVVAITGLSSFAIQDLSLNYLIRILRFILILSASLMGFFGIFLLTTALAAYMISLKSFNVPFFAPLAPHFNSSRDFILRPSIQKQRLLPFYAAGKSKDKVNKLKEGSRDD